MSFGSHEVYVGTERVCREEVLMAADPPLHRLAHAGCSARSVESAEVMMAGTSVPSTKDAGKAAAAAAAGASPPEPSKVKRSARPPLERAENLAGTSAVPARGQVLLPIIDRLLEPVRSGDDLEQIREVLEGSRQALIDEALTMHQERERFNRQLHEYEAAHGFTPVITRPSRIEEVRTRGRDLNAEIGKDARDKSHNATSTLPKVIYSSPVKNLRAAAEVAKDLSCLSGEALREQQARLNQLLSEATKQQEAFKKANPGAGASQYVVSAGGAGARSRGQASSPHPSARRAGCVTSGRRDKQIQVSSQWFRRVPAKLTNMSAARSPVRMCQPGKEQVRPELAGVTVQSSVSNKAPEVQRSSKVQVSQGIGIMMGIPPLPGWDTSSSTSRASRVSSVSWSSSSKR
jgi:hypothetical protein